MAWRLVACCRRPESPGCSAGRCGAAGRAGLLFGRARLCSRPPKSSSREMPSSLTIEYSVLTDGRDFPVSICERALGEMLSLRASSRRLRPRASRCVLSSWPTSSWTDSCARALRRSGEAWPGIVAILTRVQRCLTALKGCQQTRAAMPTLEFRQAINEALDEELARDERVVLLGEDVAVAGGVFAVTPGLVEKHGRDRVVDTPISELALAGTMFGSAVCGLRPVVEIMFADFLPLVMDSLVNQATKYWYISNEQASVPLVVRSACGAGGRFGAIHSQMPVPWLMGLPGLKIVGPATPGDAKGLLKAAIRDD